MMRYLSIAIISLIAIAVSGCAPVATTAAGVGGSAALTHAMNGICYRTFTAPADKVRVATVSALKRMKIKVVSEGRQDKGNVVLVTAITSERKIEIQIESISANATRMKVEAKSSMFSFDSATAEEIIMQTKKSLG